MKNKNKSLGNLKRFTLSEQSESKGFALIELIVVMVVLTIIAVILYIYLERVVYKKSSSQIEKTAIVVDIK